MAATRFFSLWITFVIVVTATAARAVDPAMTPFVIPATPNANSLAAYPPQSEIKVDSPRVAASAAHFAVNGKRIKFWAVNLTFGNNFPEHIDAEKLALRLSQAGVNCVRLHHMDMDTWGDAHGIWDATDPKKLSAEALDRLDYLLGQLASHGVYADVNLHVSRTHSKFLGLPQLAGESYDKMVDLFMPQLIEAQKDYARQLLGHFNQYRGVRYADDPAIAIVEISNEDSLFEWGARAQLESLSEPYAGTLHSLYLQWLSHLYGSTQGVRTAWQHGASPPGEEMLTDTQFTNLAKNWPLEISGSSAATARADDSVASVKVTHIDGTSWHIQFQQRGLRFKAGESYTLKFSARADKPRSVTFSAGQTHEPWEGLGLDSTVRLGTEWKRYSLNFAATADDENARLSAILGQSVGSVEFKDFSLRSGREGLRAGESLEAKNVALFGGAMTQQRLLDTNIFLAETEKAFWDGMYRFIKSDLNCHAMVTGTIVFGPLGLYGQSDMDFVDAHDYWHHPSFPGRAWDMGNWTIEQEAMADHPEAATLLPLACARLAGKPFTVTEYCHPAPNDYQAECVPELAAYAAAQDWDGAFLFEYGTVPNTDHFTGFFDVGANPAKWAFMSSGAAILQNAPPLPDSQTVLLGSGANLLDTLAKLQSKHAFDMAATVTDVSKLTWQTALGERIAVSLEPPQQITQLQHDTKLATKLAWETDAAHHGVFSMTAGNAFVWVGHGDARSNATVKLTSPSFAVITMVAMDNQPLATSRRVLLTTCGRCENTGMKFSKDRRTVGRAMGHGPVMIEPVDATIVVPAELAAGTWHLQPLDASGQPQGSSVIITSGTDRTLHVAASDQTAWHVLTRD